MDFRKEQIELEIPKFIFVSIIYFLGFIVLYISRINLNYMIYFQVDFINIFASVTEFSSLLDFFIFNFNILLIALSSFIFFCAGLSFLSVKGLDNLKYFIIVPVLGTGFLYNFSTLFILFSIGLFVASIYAISLGEAYRDELKKWVKFRVGSNSVSKALSVLFIFAFIGCFLTLTTEDSYKNNFYTHTKESIAALVDVELSSMSSEFNQSELIEDLLEQEVEKRMQEIREQYPDFTEAQYSEIEENLRDEFEDNMLELQNQTRVTDISDRISENLDNSSLFQAFMYWFPLMMSLSVWVFLEFSKGFLFVPISGLFSYIYFGMFEYMEKD